MRAPLDTLGATVWGLIEIILAATIATLSYRLTLNHAADTPGHPRNRCLPLTLACACRLCRRLSPPSGCALPGAPKKKERAEARSLETATSHCRRPRRPQ